MSSQHEIFSVQSPLVAKLITYLNEHQAVWFDHVDGNTMPGPIRLQAEALARILNVLFWTSLRKEEGNPITCSFLLATSKVKSRPLLFDEAREFEPQSLAKLAPATKGFHIGLETINDDGVQIWGLARDLDFRCPNFEIIGPANIAIRLSRKVIGVVSADEQHFIGKGADDLRSLISGAFDKQIDFPQRFQKASLILEMVRAMRTHGRGGILLIVPDSHANWIDSLQQPFKYTIQIGDGHVDYALSELEDAYKEMEASRLSRYSSQPGWGEIEMSAFRENRVSELGMRLANLGSAVGTLSAIDGALVLNDRLQALGFGVKITASDSPDEITVLKFYDQIAPSSRKFVDIGGTRHQSAARFVYRNHDCLAFVSSQDGALTLFAWIQDPGTLAAIQRLDLLLL